MLYSCRYLLVDYAYLEPSQINIFDGAFWKNDYRLAAHFVIKNPIQSVDKQTSEKAYFQHFVQCEQRQKRPLGLLLGLVQLKSILTLLNTL